MRWVGHVALTRAGEWVAQGSGEERDQWGDPDAEMGG